MTKPPKEVAARGVASYSYEELTRHFEGPLPDLVMRAFLFAIDAHYDQRRRHSDVPYVIHPVHVACLVKKHVPEASNDLIAACLLHDTIEDTQTTLAEVSAGFGPLVAEIVDGVTTRSYDPSWTKLRLKQVEAQRIGVCRAECHTLKCADLLSNVRDMRACDPKRYKTYVVEAKTIFDHLTKADSRIHAETATLFD